MRRPSTWILLGGTRVTTTSRSLAPISRPTPEPKASSLRRSLAMGRSRGMAWLGLRPCDVLLEDNPSRKETGMRIQRRGAEEGESELRSDWQAEACPTKAVRAALGWTRQSLIPQNAFGDSSESRGHRTSCSTWCRTSAGCGGGIVNLQRAFL